MSLRPAVLCHNNIKIFNSEFDYFQKPGVKESVVLLQYKPGIPKIKEIGFDVML